MLKFGLWGVFLHFLMLSILELGNRGEVGKEGTDDKSKATFTSEQQEAVNAIVQERLARERDKYKDYDSLVRFKEDHQKELDARAQKELEDRKEYEKAKEGYETKIKERDVVITSKDQALLDMRISHTLNNELLKQNAYIEEAIALLKSSVISQDGGLYIKSKDANNIDVNLTIEEGVKQFLAKRPHLVKAQARPGAGTPPAGGSGGDNGAGSGVDDLMKLNDEYAVAFSKGDYKRARELKVKIQGILTSKNISRSI